MSDLRILQPDGDAALRGPFTMPVRVARPGTAPRRVAGSGLGRARELGAEVIETVVLSSNENGLRFARHRGFVEIERYLLPGDTTPWIDLRLA
jgi:hypothetical protein